jgi:hypothetical protein
MAKKKLKPRDEGLERELYLVELYTGQRWEEVINTCSDKKIREIRFMLDFYHGLW